MANTRLADKLPNARFLGNYKPGDPDWDAARRYRIGGSEVAAICGESKYQSAYSLWAKKLGLIDDTVSDNEPMYWGRALEPVIINRFAEEHPELKMFRDVGTWVNRERDFQLANPDALYRKKNGELGVLEIKTARYADDWSDSIPRYYMTQVQWYLNTLGLQEAYLAVLIGGSDYREYLIEADPLWQEHDLERVALFLFHVEAQTKPDYDGSEATLNAVRQQHPQIDTDAKVELGDLGVNYAAKLVELQKVKEEVNLLASHVLGAMGNARIGLVYEREEFVRSARAGGAPYLTRKRGAK